MTVKAGSEAAFQMQVINLAGFYGWRSYHTHDSRRSQPGFPDLVLVRGAELIFAELKTETGRIRKEQDAWLADLRAVAGANSTIEVHLWRPSMLQEITDRLGRPTIGVPGDELDRRGVCPTCESPNVGETVVSGVFICHAKNCGTTWSGIRRKLAA